MKTTTQMAQHAFLAIAYAEAKQLLQAVLNDNYDLGNGREIKPKLRDEIEEFLNLENN